MEARGDPPASSISRALDHASAWAQMSNYVVNECSVDATTVKSLQDSDDKIFLMTMYTNGQPHEPSPGICLASKPWLEWCGLSAREVLWKDPTILQGKLTAQTHINTIGTYLRTCPPSGPLVIKKLVNYRVVHNEATGQSRRQPFKFTLIIEQLSSTESGELNQMWLAKMEDEQDLPNDIEAMPPPAPKMANRLPKNESLRQASPQERTETKRGTVRKREDDKSAVTCAAPAPAPYWTAEALAAINPRLAHPEMVQIQNRMVAASSSRNYAALQTACTEELQLNLALGGERAMARFRARAQARVVDRERAECGSGGGGSVPLSS